MQFFDSNRPAHGAFARLFLRHPQDTEALWEEVKDLITPEVGFLLSMILLSINLIPNRSTRRNDSSSERIHLC